MAYLTYTGDVAAGGWLPGVPASDHDEPDPDRAAAKLASGLYVAAADAANGDAPVPDLDPDAPGPVTPGQIADPAAYAAAIRRGVLTELPTFALPTPEPPDAAEEESD